ncbi:MAG: PEP-CTERM sorting domain-containing protein, partial [Phycisphaerales bacterium]|nr:PEP-CTERM sorting domain-containing protein [Phycisphaerales bacterium]
LVAATQAMAAPMFTPFLSVDVNGYNAGGGQAVGPTQAGFQGWEAAEGLFLDPLIDWGNSGAAGLTKVFATSEGNVTANMIGIVPNSFRGARHRGVGASTAPSIAVETDFVFAQRGVDGFGQHHIKLTLSGLMPGQLYEFTGYTREQFNGSLPPAGSFQRWTDRSTLGGLDGPGAYMDANFGAGSLYQPAPGGVNNPIPSLNGDGPLSRQPTSGPDSTDPYAYAHTFRVAADGAGTLELYTWADPDSFSGTQTATLLNGFELGVAPEPTSFAMFVLGILGVAFAGRRRLS